MKEKAGWMLLALGTIIAVVLLRQLKMPRELEDIKAILQMSILALIAAASIFLVKPPMGVSNEEAVRLATAYMGGNPYFAKNLVRQRIDTRWGFVFLLFSIFAQALYIPLPTKMITLTGYGEPVLKHFEWGILCWGIVQLVFFLDIGMGCAYFAYKRAENLIDNAMSSG